MTQFPSHPDHAERDTIDRDVDLAQQSTATESVETGNVAAHADDGTPAASNDCAVTDQQTVLRLPVLDNDQTPGQDLEIIALSQPSSGEASIAEDGSIRFSPDEPGRQEIHYVVDDGAGNTADAKANIFVNPDSDDLSQPVLAGLGRDELTEIARSCADGMALDVVRLAGDQILVQPPAPGQRIQVAAQPGQQIHVQDKGFLEPELLRVDGGLLIVAEDGRMIFLENFVAAAESDTPATLMIADKGPYDGGTILLASIDAGNGGDVATTQLAGTPNPFEAEPAAGGETESHGGGAGFSPYDPGDIGSGLDAVGPLGPTSVAFGVPERVLANTGADDVGSLDDGGIDELVPDIPIDPDQPGTPDEPSTPVNQAPTITINANISIEVGEVTIGDPATFIGAVPLPELEESQAIGEDAFNGVDGKHLMIGDGGDAAIIFRDEMALYQNSVGVYLIGENGEILDPHLAFVAIEHSNPVFDENGNQQHAFIRPGGGPISPGDQVLLSELYPGQNLPPGTKFGLFLVVDSGNNGQLDGTEALAFENADGNAATIFDDQPPTLLVNGEVFDQDIFHALDNDSSDSSTNQLNPGGHTQVISGLVPDGAGLSIAFEDVQRGLGDDDFNDTIVDVLPTPSTGSSLPFVKVDIAVDATVIDPDDVHLTRAVIEIGGDTEAGDALSLTATLDGTGITISDDGSSGRLVLEGTAPVETYQEILRSVQVQLGDGGGERQVSFNVVDEAGNSSNTEIVTLSPTSLTAHLGTDEGETLAGDNGADNAIAGRGGDDFLFGDSGNDIIDGGLGNDFLFGDGGDDVLIGGPGADRLNGGDGADEHRYFSITERGDRIEGFNASEGDILNFSDLLGDDSGSANIEDFLRFEQVGGNVEISVDVDGTGGDAGFVPYVTLVAPVGITTVEEAANNGTVIA